MIFLFIVGVGDNNLEHLEAILQQLQSHMLFVKESKTQFGVTEVSYLGHVIS